MEIKYLTIKGLFLAFHLHMISYEQMMDAINKKRDVVL